jgi:hypothetical protein
MKQYPKVFVNEECDQCEYYEMKDELDDTRKLALALLDDVAKRNHITAAWQFQCEKLRNLAEFLDWECD